MMKKMSETKGMMQHESFIMPMRADKFWACFLSPTIDMARVYPNYIKSHTCIKGTKSMEGSHERFDYHDGTFITYKTHKIDNEMMMVTYEVLETNIECFKGIDKIMDTYKYAPVTFCGCPWKQAMLDQEAVMKGDCGMAHMKTFAEWSSEFSAPVEPAQMEAIRRWKLDQVADMLRDMSGEEKMHMMKRLETLTDAYITSKTSGKCPMKSAPPLMEPYTMDKAEMDAKRCMMKDPSGM